MSESHRAQHQQSAGDYYAQTQQRLQQNAARFGSEDRPSAEKGVPGETQKEASAYSVTQGNQLLEGQTPRGGAPAPGQNYASASHEDLYNMVHNGLNLEEINDRSRVTNVYGNWLADASNAFRDAATTAGASWQGGAASQANSFFQNTASHTEQTGNAMQLVSNRYSQQSAAADYAQKHMPEPSGFNQQAEVDKATKMYASGDPAAATQTMGAIAGKQQQADASHQQAVQVMQGLDNTYHGTATTQPTYAPPPRPGAPDSSTHISSAQPGGGIGTHGAGVGTTGGGSLNPAGGQPGGTPGTGGGSFGLPGASSGAGNVGGPPGGDGGFRGPGGGGGTFGRVSPETMAMGGPAGGGGGGGGDITRSRPGIGTGRSGGGFAGSRVSGGGYKPGEVEEPGKSAGAGKGGAGERLERGATAAANAGKAGKPGAGGASGTGAGKKKEEDKEHKNKIAAQVDPDEVFEVRSERGPDGEKITPPVIGG